MLRRLARRLRGLASWHDAALDEDWASVAAGWRDARFDIGGLDLARTPRRSGRGGQRYEAEAVTGRLGIEGLDALTGLLLAMGETAHVGKGASEGFGRYRLG